MVVGLSGHLPPWVSAFTPEHLGDGEEVAPQTPIVADPVVLQAMNTFTILINSSTGLADSRDRSRAIDGLKLLSRASHAFDPDELMAAALHLNWRGIAAWDLRALAQEIRSGANKRVMRGATLGKKIVQMWETDAAANGFSAPTH